MEATQKRTVKEWWDDVKSDPAKTLNWLKNQYHGEATASEKIGKYILPQFSESKQLFIIERIMDDENKHAGWIKELLEKRGGEAAILDKTERYWEETMQDEELNTSPQYAAAVGAHAEEMRLERIRCICADEEAPEDIQKVFGMILKDEVFHAKAFKYLAGAEYYGAAAEKHAKGVEALGLII